MIWFRSGDRYASVATMQRVLNLCSASDPRLQAGEPLVEDGVFGRLTRERVKAAQKALDVRPASGILGPDTWKALRPIAKCRVVDVTDLALEELFRTRGERAIRESLLRQYRADRKTAAAAQHFVNRDILTYKKEIQACRAQHCRFVALGGDPIGITSLDRVYETIRRGITARSRGGWQVVLLRFTGHGGPGAQGVAASLIRMRRITMGTLTYDDKDTAEDLVETLMVSCIADAMPTWGSVELHGCNIAARRRVGRPPKRILVNGAAFVQRFADTVGRPVTATTVPDLYGTIRYDVRFEGPIVCCTPGGGTVKSWFRGRTA